MSGRGQSSVVGVAILLGVTMISLGVLTASVGGIVEHNAASADLTRVAADLEDAIAPVRTTGTREGTVAFTEGSLHTVPRDLRVMNATGTVAHARTDALVFETDGRRVVLDAGAIVRDGAGPARMYRDPPITASRADDGGVLVVGATVLNGSVSYAASGGDVVHVRTSVTHDRRSLGTGEYRVAVETDAPEAWSAYFRRHGATVLPPLDFDDDGTTSVVARYPGSRTGYFVVHDVDLEVRP